MQYKKLYVSQNDYRVFETLDEARAVTDAIILQLWGTDKNDPMFEIYEDGAVYNVHNPDEDIPNHVFIIRDEFVTNLAI